MPMITLLPLLLVAFAACAPNGPGAPGDGAAPPDPSQAAVQPTLEFTQGQASTSDAGEGNAKAVAGTGVVSILGMIATPTPCHRLTPELQRTDGALVLRVEARSDPDQVCVQAIGSIEYSAAIRGLPAGTYPVRVVHAIPGTGWEDRTVLETELTVR